MDRAWATAESEFQKYARGGSYHWRNVDLFNRDDFNPVISARYEYALRLIPPRSRRILDVGCGDAYLLYRLALQEKEVCGVDTSYSGLSAGRYEIKKYEAEYPGPSPCLVLASGYELPFREGHFDAVIATEILEHVGNPRALLSELGRVLSPQGSLVLSTPNRQTEGFRDPNHLQEYTPGELERLLSEFFLQVSLYGLGRANLLKWYKRYHRKNAVKRLMMLLCQFGMNPFAFFTRKDLSEANLLFSVCHL
jgi:2-polyprenyl-3-methyl-5-hydroxy-6-metoxy-1,4-benzoquinol methylase